MYPESLHSVAPWQRDFLVMLHSFSTSKEHSLILLLLLQTLLRADAVSVRFNAAATVLFLRPTPTIGVFMSLLLLRATEISILPFSLQGDPTRRVSMTSKPSLPQWTIQASEYPEA